MIPIDPSGLPSGYDDSVPSAEATRLATMYRERSVAKIQGKGTRPENPVPLFPAMQLPDIPELPRDVLLANEKKTLGYYISGHPLDDYRDLIASYKIPTISDILDMAENRALIKMPPLLIVGGMIAEFKTRRTKAGYPMANIQFADFTSSVECLLFPRKFEEFGAKLHVGWMGFLRGSISPEEGNPVLFIDAISSMAQATRPRGLTANPG